VAQPAGRAFAQFLSLVADDDDGLVGKACRPVLDIEVEVTRRAWNQSRISVENPRR
jgi:hypothetical protein